jgi:hypothetical protein
MKILHLIYLYSVTFTYCFIIFDYRINFVPSDHIDSQRSINLHFVSNKFLLPITSFQWQINSMQYVVSINLVLFSKHGSNKY